jgi:hypothetical protein
LILFLILSSLWANIFHTLWPFDRLESEGFSLLHKYPRQTLLSGIVAEQELAGIKKR